MLEAIEVCERVAGRELSWEMGEEPRIGDHRWWISDLAPFEADYPDWELRYGIEEILREMYEQNLERWTATRGVKLSVVMPAQNEEGSVGAHGRRRRRRAGARAAIDYEVIVVNDDSEDSTEAVVAAIGAAQPARPLSTAPTTNAASGWRSGPASTSSRATRWRS